jgi:hypothetical protein
MAEYFADLKKKFRRNFRKFRHGFPSFRDSEIVAEDFELTDRLSVC